MRIMIELIVLAGLSPVGIAVANFFCLAYCGPSRNLRAVSPMVRKMFSCIGFTSYSCC